MLLLLNLADRWSGRRGSGSVHCRPNGDELPYQMDQIFCARQIDPVGHWYRPSGRAKGQVVNRADLRDVWREMSERMAPARE